MGILSAGPGAIRSLQPAGRAGEDRCRALRRLAPRVASLLLGVVLIFGHLDSAAQPNAAGEMEIKAAFLFNFAKFVDWPAGTLLHSDDPIWFCLWGGESFEPVLTRTVEGKNVDGHPLRVRSMHSLPEIRGCQILFVSAFRDARWPQPLQENLPGVLTVGEEENFARAGGVINFVLENDHISFEINVDASGRSGVKISSKLLSLARIVHDDPSLKRD